MTNEKCEGAFLFQRLSMDIQRYNAVAIQGTFALTSRHHLRTNSSRYSFYVVRLNNNINNIISRWNLRRVTVRC